jgi:hypothetical protein
MPKNKSTNYILMQDALLEISENNVQMSRELLKEAGSEPDHLIKVSMNAIDKHRSRFQSKLSAQNAQTDIFDAVQTKILMLLNKSPEKTRSFLSGYFKEHAPSLQFGAKAGFDPNQLSKVREKIDLNDLSRKLDDHDSY